MAHTKPVASAFRRGLLTTLSYVKALFGERWLKPLTYDSPERQEAGLVIVLPGIEGASVLNHSLIHGLADAGLPYAMRLHDWTLRAKPGVINLLLKHRSRRAAAQVAELIVDYQDRYPDRPVHLIGHSGGGALIAYVLEELPAARQIDSGVMIAPALSPGYDLSEALSRVREKIFHFRSSFDWYFLGVGTSLVGTLDRRFGPSAGNRGFRFPTRSDARRYPLYHERFQEIRYRVGMIKDWHYGGHLSCMNRVFVERHISPLLLAIGSVENWPMPGVTTEGSTIVNVKTPTSPVA